MAGVLHGGSGVPQPAGCDEGSDAKSDEEEAKKRHSRLFENRDGVGERGPATEADDVNVRGDGAKEEQQGIQSMRFFGFSVLARPPKSTKRRPATLGMSGVG